MKWVEKFAESIDRFAGGAVRKEVIKASGKLRSGSSPTQRAEWIRKTMEKLEASVDRETIKKNNDGHMPSHIPETSCSEIQGAI